MIRECSLEEISDGRTYRENDMVKADAGVMVVSNAVRAWGIPLS